MRQFRESFEVSPGRGKQNSLAHTMSQEHSGASLHSCNPAASRTAHDQPCPAAHGQPCPAAASLRRRSSCMPSILACSFHLFTQAATRKAKSLCVCARMAEPCVPVRWAEAVSDARHPRHGPLRALEDRAVPQLFTGVAHRPCRAHPSPRPSLDAHLSHTGCIYCIRACIAYRLASILAAPFKPLSARAPRDAAGNRLPESGAQ